MIPGSITLPTNNCAEHYLPGALCAVCEKNHFLRQNECIPCPVSLKDEINTHLFTQCSCDGGDGFRFCAADGGIACKRGYHLQNGACVQCNSFCAACDQSDRCTEFKMGNDEHIGEIVQFNTPEEAIAILKLIMPCPELCAVCSGQVCHKCHSGYFLQESGICARCPVLNCQICSKDGSCELCLPNFRLSDKREVCSPCADENCMRCEFENGACSVCRFGYMLQSNGACAASAVSGCEHVLNIGFGQQFCAECLHGYFAEPDKEGNGVICERCPNGCKRCAGETTCDECRPGWWLSNGNCIECLEEDCMWCVDPGVCALTTGSLNQLLGIEDGSCFNVNFVSYPKLALSTAELETYMISYTNNECEMCNLEGQIGLGCKTCRKGTLNRVGDCIVEVEEEKEEKKIDDSSNIAWIAGVVVGCVLIAGGIVTLVYYLKSKKRNLVSRTLSSAPLLETKMQCIPPLNTTAK